MRCRRSVLTTWLRSCVPSRSSILPSAFSLKGAVQAASPHRHYHSTYTAWCAAKQKSVPPTSAAAARGSPGNTAPASKKKTRSPEDELLRRVNTLVGARDAAGAVLLVTQALRGEWLLSSSSSSPAAATASSPSRTTVFSSKALAATLYACDAAGAAAEGLALVAEVRRHGPAASTADWQQSEHVLFAILRLQCAAGDRDGATHMFAYLEQHGFLRLRSASVFINFCCRTLQDRRLAFAAYEKALQHKLELTEPDYVALGRLCVQVHEPVSTLCFMLDEMKEHVTEVSEAFVVDVLQPWIACANAERPTRQPTPHYRMTVVEQMKRYGGVAESDSGAAATLPTLPAPTTDVENVVDSSPSLSDARGVCPVCDTTLSGHAFTAACRTHLLEELRDVVIPQACRSRRALQGFEHWRRYIHARCDAGDRVDIFIDGANLGYYGLSSWYDLAKKELLLHRGMAEGEIKPQDLDFNLQCKTPGKSVDVGVNFALIDSAVTMALDTYGLRRPLVMLHERHVEPRFMTPQSSAIVQRWRTRGWLYCSPTGLNDDLCWLYGALLMTDPTDAAGPSAASIQQHQRQEGSVLPGRHALPHRTYVVTNDKMRDHHFRLLSPRAFTRWRDRHRIAFRCARVEERTVLHWELPAPYERCLQRHDTTETSGKGGGRLISWHIPFSRPRAATEKLSAESAAKEAAEGENAEKSGATAMNGELCDSGAPVTEGDFDAAQGDETDLVDDAAAASTWVCFTAEV